MVQTDIERLHIVGRVDKSIIKVLPNLKRQSPKEIWLFVGYCFHEFALDSVFDIVVDEISQKWDHDWKIKLTDIFDEYGRRHNSMPRGYKTICLFECSPAIPVGIKALPSLKTWDFNKKGIYLYNHESIKLTVTPLDSHYLFEAFFKMFFNQLHEKNKSVFLVDELENYIPKNITPFIIDNLLLLGKIKQGKKKNEMVLTNDE